SSLFPYTTLFRSALGTIGLPLVIDLVSISSLLARIPRQREPRAPRLNPTTRTRMLRLGQARVLQTVSRFRGGHRLLSATHMPSFSRRRIQGVSRQMRGAAAIPPGSSLPTEHRNSGSAPHVAPESPGRRLDT